LTDALDDPDAEVLEEEEDNDHGSLSNQEYNSGD
jgi:hypothetical protein